MKWKIPYPLVEVLWNDASSNSESWVHLDDIVKPEQVNTTGFLVKETDEAITIAGSVSNEEQYIETVGNTMTIPKSMIVSKREFTIRSRNVKGPKIQSSRSHAIYPKGEETINSRRDVSSGTMGTDKSKSLEK